VDLHPSPSSDWAENTIIAERTQESGHRQSPYMYSLVRGWAYGTTKKYLLYSCASAGSLTAAKKECVFRVLLNRDFFRNSSRKSSWIQPQTKEYSRLEMATFSHTTFCVTMVFSAQIAAGGGCMLSPLSLYLPPLLEFRRPNHPLVPTQQTLRDIATCILPYRPCRPPSGYNH
jgi:hypothetical protein